MNHPVQLPGSHQLMHPENLHQTENPVEVRGLRPEEQNLCHGQCTQCSPAAPWYCTPQGCPQLNQPQASGYSRGFGFNLVCSSSLRLSFPLFWKKFVPSSSCSPHLCLQVWTQLWLPKQSQCSVRNLRGKPILVMRSEFQGNHIPAKRKGFFYCLTPVLSHKWSQLNKDCVGSSAWITCSGYPGNVPWQISIWSPLAGQLLVARQTTLPSVFYMILTHPLPVHVLGIKVPLCCLEHILFADCLRRKPLCTHWTRHAWKSVGKRFKGNDARRRR